MNNQGNPQDDDTEAGTITMSIADYNRNMAAARRGGRERAERRDNPPASSTAAPAGSGDMEQRFSRLEGMFSTLIERMTPTQSNPSSTPPTDQALAPRPPAAAPAPPSHHALPTSMGVPDIWNMTAEQFVEFRNTGQLRPTLEKLWDIGARMAGAPQRPTHHMPFLIDGSGEKISNPRYRRG